MDDRLTLTRFERVLGFFSPKAALERLAYRNGIRTYLKASDESRTKNHWKKNNGLADDVYRQGGRSTRERAIYLHDNNTHIRGAVNCFTDHIVGTGISTDAQIRYKPHADPDDAKANSYRAAANQQVEDAKNRWLEQAWHIGGARLDHIEAQELQLRNLLITGESIVHRRYVRGRDIPVAYELIDPAQLDGGYGLGTTGTISSATAGSGKGYIENGIEYDDLRNIVAYWITDNGYNPKSTRVPAADILHTYRCDRPNQSRGISWLAPVIPKVYELEDILEYAAIARRVQSAIALIVADNPNGMGTTMTPAIAPPAGESKTDDDGNLLTRIEPGMIHRVGAGSVTAFTPTGSNDLDELTMILCRAIAVGLGCSYEWITGDYRQSNFASSRLGENKVWKRINTVHGFFIRKTEVAYHHDFIDWALLANLIPRPPAKVNPYAAKYSLPKRDFGVNPLQEVNAIAAALNSGLTNLQEETSKLGRNYQDNLTRIHESRAFAQALDPALRPYSELYGDYEKDAGSDDDTSVTEE